MGWKWKHDGITDIFVDMNAWPGDNESGAIFLNDQIIFINSDTNLGTLGTTS
jgi:hypothetical protein